MIRYNWSDVAWDMLEYKEFVMYHRKGKNETQNIS